MDESDRGGSPPSASMLQGRRIRLISCDDPYTRLEPGTRGVITLVDGLGTVYTFTIKLYPTSNVFKKGHRIRVDVSSSNFPRFDVNPNTGEPLNDNLYTLSADAAEKRRVQRLPQTLLDSIRAFAEDPLVTETFGREFAAYK